MKKYLICFVVIFAIIDIFASEFTVNDASTLILNKVTSASTSWATNLVIFDVADWAGHSVYINTEIDKSTFALLLYAMSNNKKISISYDPNVHPYGGSVYPITNIGILQ